MHDFAHLLDRLVFTGSRNAKLRLMGAYFAATPDPARGFALAALTGTLDFKTAKPAQIRDLVTARVDPVLFEWSYDHVGDLAETVALIWPARSGAGAAPGLPDVVTTLRHAPRAAVPSHLETWLDALDATGRWALLKLITGGLRVGVSQRLAKTALAQTFATETFDADLAAIEEVWHGLSPPYESLFAWLEGRAALPDIDQGAAFRPMMLANPLEDTDWARLDPGAYRAEWKWDGIRVQIAARDGVRRLFSRTGEDISATFPDILAAMDFDAVLDGELLIIRDGAVAPFNDLQQRLNRKRVDAKIQARHPAAVRLYDILFEDGADLRALPFDARRARLDAWHARVAPTRMDLSPLLSFTGRGDLHALHAEARHRGIEGLMLKRGDSPYVAGRPKGPWYKWKRDPLLRDAVLMYAQRGHGKRASFYSDYTFGLWRPNPDTGTPELVPVGKAYFGFTDQELRRIDAWVRANTTARYGPVRAVAPGLVLEVAFDAVQTSTRHKAGVALRFPRIHRLRWDKPAEEADTLASLDSLVEG